jgi:beta-glucosidase/6-phospho-beta-glucosidase/beta-galactosidase
VQRRRARRSASRATSLPSQPPERRTPRRRRRQTWRKTGSFDFFGLNYYIREVVAADADEPNRGWRRVPPTGELTSKGDGIAPDGLTDTLQRM